MEKPFPPWKYWTKSSLRNTLTRVLADLAEEVKKNTRIILTAHDGVAEINDLQLPIETNPAERTLIIDFTHAKLPFVDSKSKWKSVFKKSQFDILKEISGLLTTMSLKPDVKITTKRQEYKLTSLTDWQHIVEISEGKMRYEEWDSTTSFTVASK